MTENERIMEESIQEFNEIYGDFDREPLNENIESTTMTAEEFHSEWHKVLKEVFTEKYGNSQI